jgi:hypothetical protein
MIVNRITKTRIKESYGTKMPSNSSITQQKSLNAKKERGKMLYPIQAPLFTQNELNA